MGRQKREQKSTLTLAALNAHSLGAPGRLSEVSQLLREGKIDVLAVNETWQKEGEDYNLEGYRYVGKPRDQKTKKHGGGVGIFIAENLRFKFREPTTTLPDNCEMLAISVLLRGQRSAPTSHHTNPCQNATQNLTPLSLRDASICLVVYS